MTYPDETGRLSKTTPAATAYLDVAINPAGVGPSRVFIPAVLNDGAPAVLVVFCHGAGGDETQVLTGGPGDTLAKAVDNGWLVVSSLGGGTAAWGNDAAQDSYVGLVDWVRGIWAVTDVILWGGSMGALTAALLAVSGRVEDVRCLVGIDGAMSLQAFYDFTPHQINTAYDISNVSVPPRPYSTQTAGHDPCLRDASDYAGLPIFLSASTGDTVTPKVDHSDPFYTLVDPVTDVTYLTGSGVHFAPDNFMPAQVISFMAESIAGGGGLPDPVAGSGLRTAAGTEVRLLRADGRPVGAVPA